MFKNIKKIKYLYRKYINPEKVRHMRVLLNLSTKKVSSSIKEAIYKGSYELSEAKQIKKKIEKSDIFMEIDKLLKINNFICKNSSRNSKFWIKQ